MNRTLPGAIVLNTYVHALQWSEVLEVLGGWIGARESRFVCLCNVHSAVTAESDADYAQVLKAADLVLPDGMPIAWALRHEGYADQPRIGGPDLMWRCCAELERSGHSVFLFGASPETLERLVDNMAGEFPALRIAGTLSPPFRELTADEEQEMAQQINDSGAHAVFVALGCPRQEAWMHRNRGRIRAVMFGFGAAFDFHAGTVQRAPAWMQRHGLEWAHRLASEPGRLWKRYLVTNTRFIYAMLFARGNKSASQREG